MNTFVLYGMRGTGKSTIGKELALRMNYPFFDLDKFIEKSIGYELYLYVKNNGWDNFRNLETKFLEEILKKNEEHKIISLGGGTILNKKNQKLLIKNNSCFIYLNSSILEIEKKILKDESVGNKRNSILSSNIIDELKDVYNQRKNVYEEFADLIIENNETIEKTVNNIIIELNVLKNGKYFYTLMILKSLTGFN